MTIAAFWVTFIVVYVTLAASAGITRSLKRRKRNIKGNIIYCTNFTKKRQQCKKQQKQNLQQQQQQQTEQPQKQQQQQEDYLKRFKAYPRPPSRSTNSPAYFSFAHGALHPVTTIFFNKNYTTTRTVHSVFVFQHFLQRNDSQNKIYSKTQRKAAVEDILVTVFFTFIHVFINSLKIYQEKTKENHKRVGFIYVIKIHVPLYVKKKFNCFWFTNDKFPTFFTNQRIKR